MDRLKLARRGLAGLGLGLALGWSLVGCRSGHPEVPPERPYVAPNPAANAPQVGFSSEPAANAFAGMAPASSALPGMNPSRGGGYSSSTLPAAGAMPAAPALGTDAAPASFQPPAPPQGVMGTPGALPSPM